MALIFGGAVFFLFRSMVGEKGCSCGSGKSCGTTGKDNGHNENECGGVPGHYLRGKKVEADVSAAQSGSRRISNE
jgi:hypothetical protein